MGMADRFDVPVIALIDTAGAYPGIGAEERGQAEAIARSTETCLDIGVPNVAAIIGEGGSGGAIAIATANRVIMLEHAIYSVISPEGAASILWRDTAKAQDAASSMKITAHDMVRFGIVDTVVPEPTGGAHRDPAATIAATGFALRFLLLIICIAMRQWTLGIMQRCSISIMRPFFQTEQLAVFCNVGRSAKRSE